MALLVGLVAIGIDSSEVGATPAIPSWGAAEEDQFVSLINGLRASKGLGTLSIDSELVTQARGWSQTMSKRGSIFHASDLSVGVSANWQKLGENVGVGGDVQSLFDAFVASPTHYANLVDPAFTRIGVGVIWAGDRMFTAHRFMGLFPPAPPTTASPRRTTTTVASTTPDPAPTTTTVPAPPPPRTPPAADPAFIRWQLEALEDFGHTDTGSDQDDSE